MATTNIRRSEMKSKWGHNAQETQLSSPYETYEWKNRLVDEPTLMILWAARNDLKASSMIYGTCFPRKNCLECYWESDCTTKENGKTFCAEMLHRPLYDFDSIVASVEAIEDSPAGEPLVVIV
jgi:hypothetical protein